MSRMKLKADGPQDLVDAANLCLLMDAEKIRALLMYVESIAENMPRSFFTRVTEFLDKQLREKAPIVDSRIDSEEIPR